MQLYGVLLVLFLACMPSFLLPSMINSADAQSDANSSSIDLPDDPVDAPLDGGLLVLIAAGAGYGAKKYREQRKKKADCTENEKRFL